MRNVRAATQYLLKVADRLDQNELEAYADVLHDVLKRVAHDESYYSFGGYDGPDAGGEDWVPPNDVNEPMPSMEELERADFERELFDLVMRGANQAEGLSQEEVERKQQLMHYLKGNSWDSYQGDPENAKLRAILEEPHKGFMSEAIDSGEHSYV